METIIESVGAIRMAHNQAEFVGRQFFGKGSKPKGAIVRVDFTGSTVSVTFEAANAHGPYSVTDYPAGSTLKVAAAAVEAPTVPAIYSSNGGRIVCGEHGGMYLSAAIEQSPRKRTHTTPLDQWDVIRPNDHDADEFRAYPCEGCGATLAPATRKGTK